MFRCIFCNKHDETTEQAMGIHQAGCKMNPRRLVTAEEFDTMAVQVAEIHKFLSGLAEALNNPMLKAMLPPHIRGMLGG